MGFESDAEEVNSKLFVLATLLSSTILFNIKQNLSYDVLKQLRHVVDLNSLIIMKSDVHVSNSTLVSQLAPKMVILVRDSDIQLADDETSKDYLES